MRLFLALLVFLATHAAAQDVEGAADHPAIGRFEGTRIIRYEASDYDAQQILVDGETAEFGAFEGAVTKIVYEKPDGASDLQIIRSFQEKLEEEGFETIVECPYSACRRAGVGQMRGAIGNSMLGADYHILTLERLDDNAETRAQIVAGGRHIFVNVVEDAVMENKAIDAVAIETTLLSEGRMAIYDIRFDTGSANLTGDSGATIDMIAEVLAQNPEMDVIIVGHTDNVGDLEMNLALSRNRAQAVVDRLTSENGVAGARLTGAGVAFLAPVSTNATEAGRALNRRVEIVVR